MPLNASNSYATSEFIKKIIFVSKLTQYSWQAGTWCEARCLEFIWKFINNIQAITQNFYDPLKFRSISEVYEVFFPQKNKIKGLNPFFPLPTWMSHTSTNPSRKIRDDIHARIRCLMSSLIFFIFSMISILNNNNCHNCPYPFFYYHIPIYFKNVLDFELRGWMEISIKGKGELAVKDEGWDVWCLSKESGISSHI